MDNHYCRRASAPLKINFSMVEDPTRYNYVVFARTKNAKIALHRCNSAAEARRVWESNFFQRPLEYLDVWWQMTDK